MIVLARHLIAAESQTKEREKNAARRIQKYAGTANPITIRITAAIIAETFQLSIISLFFMQSPQTRVSSGGTRT